MGSINAIFAQGGPQLGELEAGVVAQGFGAPLSVVTGGLACIAVTAWIAWRTPALRGYGAATVQPQPTPANMAMPRGVSVNPAAPAP
jgi:hypothetical protein